MSPRPFQIDPVDRIRPIHRCRTSGELHHAAMGNSLWAKLGTRFLKVLYTQLVQDDRFFGFVYLEKGIVRGFIAGSLDPDAMMHDVFRKGWFLLGPAAFPKALQPEIFRYLMETRHYASASNAVTLPEPIQAESLFVLLNQSFVASGQWSHQQGAIRWISRPRRAIRQGDHRNRQ